MTVKTWSVCEQPDMPGRFVIYRAVGEARAPVGVLHIEYRALPSPVALAAVRLMAQDAVNLWNNPARVADELWDG